MATARSVTQVMDVNRRTFLWGATGAAAACAFGGINVYTSGMAHEDVLKITHLEIDLGLRHAFKAFHFSDTHLNFFDAADLSGVSAESRDHYHRRWGRFPQALSSFYASVDYAMMRRMPLLHTGDLVDFANAGNTRVLRHVTRGLDWLYAIGNHEYQHGAPERYAQDTAAVRAHLRPYLPNDLTVASRVLGEANFISFDNARFNLRPETIAGVKKAFGKGLPVVLMCHVPPVYTPLFREHSRRNKMKTHLAMGGAPKPLDAFKATPDPALHYDAPTRAFYDWLRRRKDLKAILCGHMHWPGVDDFSETAKMYVAGGNFEGQANEIVFK